MKIITPVTVGCIILLITVGIYSNLYIFKLFKPQIMLAGCMLPYFGYILGGLIAFVVRLPWERVKTVAIETGMQNTGIAIILMMFAFVGTVAYFSLLHLLYIRYGIVIAKSGSGVIIAEAIGATAAIKPSGGGKANIISMIAIPVFCIPVSIIYRRCNKEKYATVPTKNGKSTEMDEYPPDKTVK
jgi:hypothetical protein